MFQLTKKEIDILQFLNGTANFSSMSRSNPYVFTEQGIYMVATILKNDIATQQSISIMRSFKKMRHYIAENQMLLNNPDILSISNRLVQHEEDIQIIKSTMATKMEIDRIMNNFIDEDKVKEIVILNGHRFEAIEAYTSIY